MLPFSEFGVYRYRDQVFFDKLSAVDYAREHHGDKYPTITFDFNDAAFSGSTVEPERSLAELYRDRAQELRDRFDHLILMYSGGTDSHQVLMSFLKNGIHLDEVRSFYPLGFIHRLDERMPVGQTYDMLLDYKRLAIPGLRTVHKHAPRTLIRPVDMTASYVLGWDDGWLEELCPWPKPTSSLYNAIKRNAEADDLQRRADRLPGKSVGVIYGVEKPFMRALNGRLYFFFADVARVGVHNIFVNGGKPLFTPVMFYWGAPQIVIKQAHVVRKAFSASARARAFVLQHRCNIYTNIGIPDIELSLIYPDWYGQQPAKVNSKSTGIITDFIDRPAREFTEARRNYFERRFGTWRNDDFLSETQSKLHLVGSINALQDDHQPSERADHGHVSMDVLGQGIHG